MKHVLSLAASAFVSCGALAADFSFEGRWMLPSGQPGANVDSTCTLRFYSADGASSPAGEQAGVPFQTDKDGYFVVGGPVPANMPDTFWVGVKPAESDEIVPRFRVAPVPYAFAASEANLVESDSEVVVDGTATVRSLAVAGDVVTDEWLLPEGGEVTAWNLQVDNVRVEKMKLENATFFSMFRNDGAVSPDYDRMSADRSVGAEVHAYHGGFMDFNLYAETRDNSMDATFDSDGFLVFAIKAQPKKCPAPEVTVTVGTETFVSDFRIGSDKGNNTVKRCMTVPYRAGEQIRVYVKAVGYSDNVDGWWGGNVSDYTARIDVKVKLVRFGR